MLAKINLVRKRRLIGKKVSFCLEYHKNTFKIMELYYL